MTRTATFAAGLTATLAVAASFAATASAAIYSGDVKGLPDSDIYLTFTRDEGRLYLEQVELQNYPLHCENGDSTLSTTWYVAPEGRVEHRGFKVSRPAPARFLVSGDLRGGGKARGVLRETRQGETQAQGTCDTGRLEWTAQKGI